MEYLAKWLAAREHVTENPVVRLLHERVRGILADGVLDVDEAKDFDVHFDFLCGRGFRKRRVDEVYEPSSLRAAPAPMAFPSAPIWFTGTFAFGTRKECEAAAASVGAVPGSLTAATCYLIIGVYATESWSQSSFGRKVEKAVELRAKGRPVNIIGETHWVEQMTTSGYGGRAHSTP